MIEGMLIGAAVFAAGVILGRFLPGHRKRDPGPPKPVCGCAHELAYHDTKTGECHGTTEGGRTAVRDRNGNPARDQWGGVVFTYEHGRCACKRYTGPEPLPEYYAPEIGNA